jgi:3-deoxy-D-manno-octulosonic-acid transferase
MQSETDRQRIQEIGADPQKVTVFGNLKYDVAPRPGAVNSELARLLSGWNQVWMAASTMPGEEELIVNAYRQLTSAHPELKLVIAPRHPERFEPVAEILKRSGLAFSRRTQILDNSSQTSAILLLDSIGELAALFRYATVVFMGGSLVARGGHNILEPARHGKPVIFGPHMENFRDMARLFLDAKGAVQIKNGAELVPAISDLLSNPGQAGWIGSNALAIVEENAGATERVLQVLEPIGATR